MQSYFFHLMPWTEYPEDFEEKYESSWVTHEIAAVPQPRLVRRSLPHNSGSNRTNGAKVSQEYGKALR